MPHLTRRTFIAGALASPGVARAQEWPTRQVQLWAAVVRENGTKAGN